MRNAVQGDIVRVAERIESLVGDLGDTTRGYLVAPARLTAEIVEGAYRLLGKGGETVDTFIDRRGGDAALRDMVSAVLAGAETMTASPSRMTGKTLGAAASLVPSLMMRWDEVHIAGEFLFHISAEVPGTTQHWRHSDWQDRLIKRMRERRRDQMIIMHEEMREALMGEDDVDDMDDEEFEEYNSSYRDLIERRRRFDRRIDIPHPDALASAHEDEEAMPQWIQIELGDCRFEDGKLSVRTPAPWHAPDDVIDKVAEAVERMLDVVSESGGQLDSKLSQRRRGIAEMLHDVPHASLLDVKVRNLTQDEGGRWTGQVSVISDIRALDTFGSPIDLRIHDHAYDVSDKGLPKSLDGLIRHQTRIAALMVQEHQHSPFTVEAVLARAMALLDPAGLAKALRTPAATAGKKARALGLPPAFRTLEASKGRITGRIALSETVSYRDGTLRARGISLPQAAIEALPGRPVSALVESPLLGDAPIKAVRSTKDGIIVKIDIGPDVAFDDIVGEAGGDKRNT